MSGFVETNKEVKKPYSENEMWVCTMPTTCKCNCDGRSFSNKMKVATCDGLDGRNACVAFRRRARVTVELIEEE